MWSFKSNTNIHKKEGGSYYVVLSDVVSNSNLVTDFASIILNYFRFLLNLN